MAGTALNFWLVPEIRQAEAEAKREVLPKPDTTKGGRPPKGGATGDRRPYRGLTARPGTHRAPRRDRRRRERLCAARRDRGVPGHGRPAPRGAAVRPAALAGRRRPPSDRLRNSQLG